MEAARAYQRLLNEFGLTQETVAQRIGKDRSSIANFVRLVNLPNEIQGLIESGHLSTGHAKVLLGLTRAELQLKLARQIVDSRLSVRQAEQLVSRLGQLPKVRKPARRTGVYTDVEEKLQRRLGTRVHIVPGQRGGKITLDFFNSEDLDRLVELLLD